VVLGEHGGIGIVDTRADDGALLAERREGFGGGGRIVEGKRRRTVGAEHVGQRRECAHG